MTLQQLLNSLTTIQALEYNNTTDKYLWVMDNIIDPLSLSIHWIDAIETKLESM